MKKSIFLFFAAILCAIGMNAATVTSDGTARLYFNLNAVSWWNAGTNGDGNFAYFFNNSTGKNAWSAHAVKHSGDTYYVVIPNGTWAGVILTRNNTSTAPSWNNKWNQTGDIGLSSTSNYISKFSEGSATVTWGTAVKPVSNAAVSAAASTIFVGASTTLTSSLTSNTNLNTVKSATYSTTSGASISGTLFTASTAGTYTVTATVTYNPNGYPSITSTATATTTITVEELPTYTVTVNAGEGGTVTEGGIVTEGSSINITATPAENYEFNGWTITTGEGTFDNENAVSTTFSPTSDATIQANFRSTATYALKVIAGANIASAEGNVDPVTLGESYDITATPVVGYTFAGWTAEPTENATFATQESTTQVTVLNGSVNVTATATETMSALTTANSFDQDTPPAQVPTATATEIGIVTTAEVTATDVTGYTFVGWELTNCVSDDELTAKTIAVKSNGDGAAATATAKYEIIKLTYTVIVPEGTEKCYIAGDMNTWTFTEMENQGNNVFTLTIIGATKEHGYKYACGNEWKYVEKTADGNEVSNRSYTANDKVLAWNDPLATNLYLRGTMNGWGTTDRFKKETEEATTAIVIVKLDANTTYDFKVANADWSEGYSSTTAFTATSTQTLSTDVQDNAKLTTVAAGDYTFTWDLSTKKLTVTYPELPKYTVTATSENGTIEGIENEGVYTQGATITLTATANDHYVFVNWTKGEDVVAETAEYTFTVEADVELVANFRHVASTINAHPNDGENGVLAWFISQAHAGDTVILADGEYIQEGSLTFDKPGLVIMAAENAKPVIKSGSYAQHYATTTIIGVTFDGKFSEEKQAEHGIYSYENTSKNLTLINCEFRNYENYLLTCSSSAHVDSLVIDGCLLHDCGDAAVYYQETDLENNVPTCSYFKMTNSTVYNINGTQYYAAIDIRENSAAYGQGGNKVIIDHVTIYNYATPLGAIRVYKSPDLAITNSIISNPTAVNYSLYIYGGTVDNTLYFNGAADSRGQYTNCLNVDPLFVDADNGNFELMPLSPARGAATDGGDLGDPRWYTSVTKYTVTATANPAEAGTVTGAGEYTEGKEVTLVATPAYGYNFVNWTKGEEIVAETAEYTFTASADIELVANFEEKAVTGNIINVEPGEGTLATAVEEAQAGDKLVLADGTYTQEYSINMDKAGLIITAAENAKPVIQLTGEWTTLNVSASTTFEGITFDANNVAKYIIATLDSVAMTTDLVIYNCEFKNWLQWAISNQYAKNVSAKSVVIDNCLFHDGTNSAIRFSENAPEGKNACQYLEVSNSTFHNIGDANAYSTIYSLARTDAEAAASNEVVVNHCTFYNCQAKNTDHAAVRVSYTASISNTIIVAPEAQSTYRAIYAVDGSSAKAINCLTYNYTKDTGGIRSAVTKTNCLNVDPLFVDAANGNFNLLEGSPAIGAATDGNNLGDPRWVVSAPLEPETYTVSVVAENGTVTGAGEYEAGAEVTLTATPDFDYEFVKWSNESTENPLTITVEDNIELQAIFAEVAPTEVKESGVFSISAHKTATFATGNLQYNVGTDTWRFAKQQYQVVGEQNIQLGHPDFTGWIDMLGYSADGKFGVNPSNANADYAEEFVDWGTLFPEEGWSTLSKEDWKYLLEERTNAANLQQVAKVGTMVGILLFPDAWTMPDGCTVEAEKDEYFNVNIYNYTIAQWNEMEAAGAVFLPAAGRRTGGYGNKINYDQVEETDENNLNGGYYRHQDNTNIYCYYWTSTINAETKNVSYLHNIVALGNDEYTIGTGAIWGEKGRYGQSVRLAKVVYDKHEVTVTTENGTVTGAGEYTHGEEVTLTATPEEHYVFVNWTAGETVLSSENPYIFTLEKDVELTANFALDTHTVAATAENGSVTGAGIYEHGKEVTLTATADEGYEFVNWTAGKDTVSTEATYTFTVEADVNLVANFQEVVPVITHTVTWYTAVGETAEVTLEEGAAITKPETNPELEGYVFMGWTNECFVAEDGSDFAAIEDFGTADADKEYYAVFAKEMTTGGAASKTYSFDITKADFNTTSYAANNTTKTSKATASDGSTLDVQWTSNQVMLQSSAIQFKKNEGYIYNDTDLKNIISVEVTSTAGTFTTYYGTSSQPSNNTSVGSENGYFKIKVGNATGKCSNIKITFAHVISGEPTTTYSNYMTTCTPEEYTIEWSVNGKVTETTTVVEGDALVLPEAPAAPDACSDKVFMGWATTATVNTDGSAISWVKDTIIPESDNTYYAVFATEIKEETNETYTKTATVNIADYATANSWADATKYENVIIDQNITATAISTGSNTGKYYANGNNWRLYQTEEDATLTIGAAEGVTINSVIVTYATSSNGVLTFNTSKIASGTTVEVNAPSVTFGIGNTGTATNGQVRVTKIAVDYTFSGTITSTTYTDYSTICVIPEYTVTFDYSVDAGYIIVNDKRISEKKVKYVEGTELTVKALTFNNYRFDAWMDEEENELSITPEYTFTVTADVVLTAVITYEQGAVGTSVENNNVVTSETMKVIQNGRLFIIREGKIYNAQGQVVK